jgi:hypothetical protein
MAAQVTQMEPGEGVGMWRDMIDQFQAFVNRWQGEHQSLPLTDANQYDYVGCFLNSYRNAAHNQNLLQSMNDTAQHILDGRLQ